MDVDKAMFKSFDTNGDGYVDVKEFEDNLKPKTRKKIEEKLDAGWKFDEAKWKESQARHAFAVGERVEAHWQKKWWPAAVHTLVGDGSYEVHWDDGRYDYVAANAVRSVPSGALARLGRIFGK